jgi:transcriptional regulator with XRE-family HTH domain
VDKKQEVQDFLVSPRARVTPEQAGVPIIAGERRVPGLRREEVAMLAGVSLDYYKRLERGNLGTASETVLNALADALQLSDAERDHLFDLAHQPKGGIPRPKSRGAAVAPVRESVQRVLGAMNVAAIVQNGRQDIVASNELGRAMYSPHYDTDGQPNIAPRRTELS